MGELQCREVCWKTGWIESQKRDVQRHHFFLCAPSMKQKNGSGFLQDPNENQNEQIYKQLQNDHNKQKIYIEKKRTRQQPQLVYATCRKLQAANGRTVRVWDLKTGRELWKLMHKELPQLGWAVVSCSQWSPRKTEKPLRFLEHEKLFLT